MASACARQVFEAARVGDAVKLWNILKRIKSTDEITAVLETKTTSTSSIHWLPMVGEITGTPLIAAAEKGHLECVKILLRYNADIESRAEFSAIFAMQIRFTFSSLFLAASNGHLYVLSCLVENGADVNSPRSDDNFTPLMIASTNDHMNIVTFLVENGANIDLQNKNGDTALHFAVCANLPKVVKKLLTLGASQLYNNQRLTPLLMGSDICNVEMVESLISKPQCTKEQRIDALELIGASIAAQPLSESVSGIFLENEAFQYMKRGMEERFQDPSQPFLKQSMEPVEAYQSRPESQTLEELARIEGDRNAIMMEGLIVRERILGRDNMKLVTPIQVIADYHRGRESFDICIGLLAHAMDITQQLDKSIDLDLLRIINVLHQMIQNNFPLGEKFLIKVLEQTVLEYGKQPEKLRKELEAVTSENGRKFLKGVKEHEEKNLMDHLLRLLQIFSKVDHYDEDKSSSLSALLGKLSYLNPRDEYGNTLLHLAAGQERNEFLHAMTFPHSPLTLPCTNTVKLLLNAGMDVNVKNSSGDTPLHTAVSFEPSNNKIQLLTDTLKVLLDGGAHHDFVNNDGKTAMHVAKTNKARRILFEKRKLELKCISARAIKRFNLPYLGLVPKPLERYITMH